MDEKKIYNFFAIDRYFPLFIMPSYAQHGREKNLLGLFLLLLELKLFLMALTVL